MIKYCIVLLCLVVSSILSGQKSTVRQKKKEITIILANLENKHNIKFSFEASAIKDLYIAPIPDSASLPEVLKSIQNDTPLAIKKISERYYSIKRLFDFCGYLKNSQTGSFIKGVTIITADKSKKAITDDNGFFRLELIDVSDKLICSYEDLKTSYLAPRVPQSPDSCEVFVLRPNYFYLDEVIVSDYLIRGMVKTKNGATGINPKQLGLLPDQPEPDLLKSLQYLPGIESPTEKATELYIRGGTPNQNLILWNDIRVFRPSHLFGMISALDPNTARYIRVFKSATDPQYGDNVSGVVDIKTDTVIPAKIKGGVGLNMLYGGMNLKVPIGKKYAIFMTARRSYSDFLRTSTFNNYYNRVLQNTILANNDPIVSKKAESDDFLFWDTTFKVLGHISPTNKVSASMVVTDNGLDSEQKLLFSDKALSNKLGTTNFGLNLKWTKNWTTSFHTELNFHSSEYKSNYSGKNPIFDGDVEVRRRNSINEKGIWFNATLKPNSNFSLTAGYQINRQKVFYALFDGASQNQSEDIITTNSLFSKVKLSNSNGWSSNLGLRFNSYGKLNEISVEPRLYLQKVLKKNLTLRTSFEMKSQIVNQIIDIDGLGIRLGNNVWVLADNDLVPLLSSNQFSLGLFYRNKWDFDIDFYFKNIDGLTGLTQSDPQLSSTFLSGKSKAIGADFLVSRRWGDFLTSCSYSISRTTNVFPELNNGNRFIASNSIPHSLKLIGLYDYKKYRFSLGWTYRSGIPFTTSAVATDDENDLKSIIYDDKINTEKLPNYQRLDLSVVRSFNINKKKNSPTAKIGVSFLNFFNRTNQLKRSFALTENFISEDIGASESEIEAINTIGLGLTSNVFLKLSF